MSAFDVVLARVGLFLIALSRRFFQSFYLSFSLLDSETAKV
jgi:hypothetical protein